MIMTETCWQIVGDYGNGFHAGPKAQRDVTAILDKMGFKSFSVRRHCDGGAFGRLMHRLVWLLQCRMLRKRLPENSVLFMQYPSAAWSRSPWLRVVTPEVKKHKHIKLVSLFHDFPSLRWGSGSFESRPLCADEADLMALSDVIIVHNDSMKDVLVKHGIPVEKMVSLEAFDYLTPCEPKKDTNLSRSVVIAGCLAPDKVGYLDGVSQIGGVNWNLYGVQFDPSRLNGDNIKFIGCFPPEELPEKLEGSFGLVWDGPSIDTCTGDLGNYLRINNPHKLSLYLASEMPVIIWDQAAEADFVRKHGVGICVTSLREISERLNVLKQEDYELMRRKASEVSAKMRSGGFLKAAVSCALKMVDGVNR